jgi:hypothetical protein
VSLSATFTAGGKGDAEFSLGGNGALGTTTSDSHSTTITKTQGFEAKLVGNIDGVDHSQDEFIVLLNPQVVISEIQAQNGTQCSPPAVTWGLARAWWSAA